MKTTPAFATTAAALPVLAVAATGIHASTDAVWPLAWVMVLVTLRLVAPVAFWVLYVRRPADRTAMRKALRTWRGEE